MNYADCVARLIEAAGRQLTDQEVSSIFGRVHQAALDLKAGRASPEDIRLGRLGEKLGIGQSQDEMIRKVAQRAASELLHEAAVRERQAHLQIAKTTARADDVARLQTTGLKDLDALDALIARDYSGRTNVESVEQRVMGIRSDLKRQIAVTWDALGNDWLGFFQNRQKMLTLVRELRGERTGDALAAKGAKAFHDAAEQARLAFNAAGGDVGRLDDWGMPQHHSQEKVAVAGREPWIEYVLPRLDRARYVDDLGIAKSDAQLREFLSKAWDTIATNGITNIKPGQFKGTGKRANRHAENRQIHFKDANAVIEYWETFGDRTVVEILNGHIERMARDIAFTEKLGPNPDLTYQTLRDRLIQEQAQREPQKIQPIQARALKSDNLFAYAAGQIKPTSNATLANVADGIAQLNVAGKLGGAAIASLFGDKITYEAVSHLNDIPAMQRWSNEVRLLNPANVADRRMLIRQGLMADYVRNGLNRFYEGLGEGGGGWSGTFKSVTGKFANAVMRISGMNAINELRKGAFGMALMDSIGTELTAGKDFNALADSDVRVLRTFGVTEADWNVWKLAELEDFGYQNKTVLTPEAIARISDARIETLIPERIMQLRGEAQARIDELNVRNQTEIEWIRKRTDKFRDVQIKAAEQAQQFAQSSDVKLQQLAETTQVRADLLAAELERAQLRADIDAYLLTAKTQETMRRFLDDVEEGAAVERGVRRERVFADRLPDSVMDVYSTAPGIGEKADLLIEKAVRRRGALGEQLGRREGSIQRRIIELETKLRAAERDFDAQTKTRAKTAAKKIEQARQELTDFVQRSNERRTRRQAVMDRLASEIEPRIQQEITTVRRDAIVKLLGAVNTESEFAVTTPGWRERAELYGRLQRGTIPGEIVRSILQFKSFPWTILKRNIDVVANMDGPAGKAAIAAAMILGTTLAGAMTIQVRDMLTGKDPRRMMDDNWYAFWGKAFLQGGAMGIYGDFLSGAGTTQYGSGILETLSGPTVGPLLELGLVQPLQAIAKQIEGKETHLAAQTLQDLKGFIPGNNLWYTKAALDHLIWQQAMEALSPGYLANIKKRSLKEYQQRWYWAPGEPLPERPPALSEAVR